MTMIMIIITILTFVYFHPVADRIENWCIIVDIYDVDIDCDRCHLRWLSVVDRQHLQDVVADFLAIQRSNQFDRSRICVDGKCELLPNGVHDVRDAPVAVA